MRLSFFWLFHFPNQDLETFFICSTPRKNSAEFFGQYLQRRLRKEIREEREKISLKKKNDELPAPYFRLPTLRRQPSRLGVRKRERENNEKEVNRSQRITKNSTRFRGQVNFFKNVIDVVPIVHTP